MVEGPSPDVAPHVARDQEKRRVQRDQLEELVLRVREQPSQEPE